MRNPPELSEDELCDDDFLAEKANAALRRDQGDGFELLIILLFILRAAVLVRRGKAWLGQTRVRRANGEFVDDVKFHYPPRRWTRYVHAKSGSSVKWDRNLKRDFRSQLGHVTAPDRTVLELWLGSKSDMASMRRKASRELPKIRYHALDRRWLKASQSEIPYIAYYLREMVGGATSARLLRNAWLHLATAWGAHRNQENGFD